MMPNALDKHINEMVDLNMKSYHRGMQDALAKVSESIAPFRQPLAQGPFSRGVEAIANALGEDVAKLRAKSAKLCHESRGEHECDEYCPPPF